MRVWGRPSSDNKPASRTETVRNVFVEHPPYGLSRQQAGEAFDLWLEDQRNGMNRPADTSLLDLENIGKGK